MFLDEEKKNENASHLTVYICEHCIKHTYLLTYYHSRIEIVEITKTYISLLAILFELSWLI